MRFRQGYGDAAYRLGQTLNVGDENYARALIVLHEGVKFGSKDSARALSVSFGLQRPLTGNLVDRVRSDRYSTLFEALELNPDLRFPNLDKVLPLPPADLPYWDGKRETLINAAKTVVVEPVAPSTPGANRVGRAHIPAGHVLPQRPVPLAGEVQGMDAHADVPASTRADYSGYWRPQLSAHAASNSVTKRSTRCPRNFRPLPSRESASCRRRGNRRCRASSRVEARRNAFVSHGSRDNRPPPADRWRAPATDAVCPTT